MFAHLRPTTGFRVNYILLPEDHRLPYRHVVKARMWCDERFQDCTTSSYRMQETVYPTAISMATVQASCCTSKVLYVRSTSFRQHCKRWSIAACIDLAIAAGSDMFQVPEYNAEPLCHVVDSMDVLVSSAAGSIFFVIASVVFPQFQRSYKHCLVVGERHRTSNAVAINASQTSQFLQQASPVHKLRTLEEDLQ